MERLAEAASGNSQKKKALLVFVVSSSGADEVELSDSTSHTITDAYAGKEYIIQLAAKDMEIGTWSDWSVAVHATPWMEEPKPITSTTESDIIPETTPGPPSAAPRVGEPTAACSTLLWSTHLLLACVLLSIM
ncbi:ciliary neurotrophic factor receptor subunit alpha-like [Sinocyclocheilus rhinocerous]|uniref:ciliary neurotrophic factor receptor subunit alpha-like n=1 Tax=Sinocyclocheilus rhinocerous TaxID=307959 RepID=UPI0007B94216|nr:PREDICTED: ciliary neurotrophic factor receptor subunit alpha-like [Sinocyclocheilus rhinocerous]